MSSWRVGLAWFVCCVLAVTGVLVLNASHNGGESGRGSAGFASLSIASNLLAVPGVQRLDGGEQERDQLLASRANPEAANERLLSRTQYERLGASGAARVIRQVTPTIVAKSPSGIGSLPAGARVSRYLSTNAARLDLPGGKHAIVESMTPAATPTPSGGYAPVVLALRESGQGFVAENPAVPVSIPRSLASGVRIDSTSVSLTPVDAAGASLAGSGQIDGGAVVYPNTATDTDTAAKPTSSGLEVYDTLRSVDSPQRLSFEVGMPQGASLVASRSGTGTASVVAAGRTLAVIPTASAVDASGTPVPVSTKVDGNTLELQIDHRSGDYRYPIVVDPTVIDSKSTNWRFEHGGGSGEFAESFEGYVNPTESRITLWRGPEANEWGALIYPTQGESRIYEMSMETSASMGSNVENHLVIAGPGGWEGSTALGKSYGKSVATVCVSFCATSAGKAANIAAYWVNAISTTSERGEVIDYAASVYIAQNNGPAIAKDTTKEHGPDGFYRNAFYGGGNEWISPNGPEAVFDLSDPGIGVDEVQYTVGATKWSYKLCESGAQCYPSTSTRVLPIEGTRHLPEGEETIEAKALNAMGSSATTTATIKVDSAAPHEITLSGLPESGVINDATQGANALKLVGHATDGVTGTLSSGVASLKLAVDGREFGSPNGSCTPGPCTATGEWTINGEEFAVGEHTLTVTATDVAGNSATSNTTFSVHHAAPVSFGPGELNPVTGEFDLEETDVSTSTIGAPLSIVRGYSSREPSAGSEGMLGAPWNVSLGGAQDLLRNPNGSVTLIAPSGDKTTFTSTGGGKFEPPVGDAGLVLSANGGETEYTLADNGSSTVFKHISGDNEAVFRASIASGVSGSNTTQFTYQSVGGVVEPEEELGPVPAGVSCTPTLNPGCRALTFNYATSTTATGEGASQWGDYTGRLTRVYFVTGEEKEAKIVPVSKTVAQYSYDNKGRLRAEWDPRISPALKTTYGYDAEGHVTAITPAGKESWAFTYGTTSTDTRPGRLIKAMRPPASESLWGGEVLKNTAVPVLSGSPVVKVRMTVSDGTWSGGPIAYAYQWEDCNSSGAECKPIGGATNANYKPVANDVGHTLVAQVMATNGGGSISVGTAASGVVASPSSGVPRVTQSIEANALNAVTCVPGTTDCVVSDSKGNAYYATNVSVGSVATWTSWSGPGTSPSEALTCPTTSLCLIADGEKGRLYHAGSFGGSWTQSIAPTAGVVAITCASSSFCLDGQGAGGQYRYSTNPPSISWKGGEQGSSAMKGVFCLSSSFCAIANGAGKVFISTTTAQIETSTMRESTVDGTTPLNGVSCSSTSSCVAVDTNGNVLSLAVASGGEATATKQNIDGANSLTAVTCTGSTCVTVDNQGNVFVSIDSGKTWVEQYQLNHPLTAVSCSSASLCATVDTSGNLTAFNPNSVQAVDANGLNAVACAPSTTDCVVSDSKGGAYYSTNVSVGGAPTWSSWSGPAGKSPSEALSCPTSSLCLMADGTKEGGFGGNLYYATSLGGSWTLATEPAYGVDAVSCASSSFCVSGQNKLGYFRYATSPASTSWTLEQQGGKAMKSVFCLSSSFCAMADDSGTVYVGTSTAQIESSSWKESTVDSGTALNGITCTSTTSCVAVDKAGNVLNLTIGSGGEATAVKQDIDETNSLAAVACGGTSCVTVDGQGNVFGSTDSGKTWVAQYQLNGSLTGVSCASSKLCETVDTTGHVFVFDPTAGPVTEGEARSPQPGTTVEYNVPASGGSAPYSLSSGEVSKWAQTDIPVEATAIFPSDEAQGWPASDYRRATIDYLDINDRIVNVASPGGGVVTSEYNSHNDVVRNLSADNRAAALKEGSKSSEVSQTLDTQSTYNSEGTELLSTLGPLHTVKLASGTTTKARAHTVYSYDEGAPETGGPYRLVTKVTEGAQITGEPEADVRTTTKSYAGQNNLGWMLREPTATVVDPSGLDQIHSTVYDPNTGKVTETRTPGAGAADETFTGYEYSSTFGSYGTANGQMREAQGVARDAEGNVWIADTYNNRVEEFSSGGTFIQKFGGPGVGEGSLEKPYGIAIDKWGNVWVTDTAKNKVDGYTKSGTFIKGIGLGLLKEPMGLTYSPYNGDLYIADTGDGRVVQINPEKESEWAIIGKKGEGNGEFKYPEGIAADSSGNIWVSDGSRIQKLSATGTYISKFGVWGTGNGELKNAVGIAIDSKGNVLVADAGNHRIQAFSSSGAYQYQFGGYGEGEAQMRYPTGMALDGSDNMFMLDPGNNRIQKWAPNSSNHEGRGNGGTHGVQTIYYTAGTNSEVSGCGNHPEWAGLPCEKRPAAQPETSGVPNLPVTTLTYNVWDEPLVSTETVGSTTRTNTNVYDEAERLTKDTVSSSVGTALPSVVVEYNSETGDATKSSTTVEGVTKSLESAYDKRGELTSYKDADGNTSTFSYDAYGRLESVNDGKGTQSYTYDTTTGQATKLVDSAAGTFTASYDVEGGLTTAGYPNGMNVNHTYDAAGSEVGVEYVKTTHCTTGCTWFSQSESPSIHGQALSQSSTLSSQAYTYDAAGRLTKSQDTPTGEGCTTRIYAYDQETNINSLTTRTPGGGGSCATEGGSALNHTYDTANRLTDTGTTYDTFGDITKLPAGDAGGSEVASTFYVDETLATQSQNGQTLGYYLDPSGRDRQIVSTGTVNSTVTYHYAGDGRTPAWTEDTAGKWTRNIYGLEGLVAIQNGGESPVLQIQDLKGDIVGTASLSETATGLLSKGDSTEYGVPRTSSPPKYSWQGGAALRTELQSGIVAMGARSYVPEIGRFLQPDPVEGGSANAYAYTYGDPVGSSDPSGEFTVATPAWVGGFFDEQAEVATEAAIQRAAEEQAAREEAEEKARAAAEEAAEAAEAAAETAAKSGGGKHRHRGGGHAGGKMAERACVGCAIKVPPKLKEKCDRQCKIRKKRELKKEQKEHEEEEERKKRQKEEEECGGVRASYRPGESSVGNGLYYAKQAKHRFIVCVNDPGPGVDLPCEAFGCDGIVTWQQWPGEPTGAERPEWTLVRV